MLNQSDKNAIQGADWRCAPQPLRFYPNRAAALREVREMRGWPNAYLVKVRQ